MVRKWVRKALRDVAKIVLAVYRALVPVLTGAMRDAAKIRTARGLKRGELGASVFISRDRLFALHTKRGGGNLWYRRKGKTSIERFFYPAVVEFGDHDTPAKRPLRDALYRHEHHFRDAFIKNIRSAIAEAGRQRKAANLVARTQMAWALDLDE